MGENMREQQQNKQIDEWNRLKKTKPSLKPSVGGANNQPMLTSLSSCMKYCENAKVEEGA